MSTLTAIDESGKSRPGFHLSKILLLGIVGTVAILDIAGHRRFPNADRDFQTQTDAMIESQKEIHATLDTNVLSDPGPDGRRTAEAVVKLDANGSEKTDIYYSDHFHRWMNGTNPIDSNHLLHRIDEMVDNRALGRVMMKYFGIGLLEASYLVNSNLLQINPAMPEEVKPLADLASGLTKPSKSWPAARVSQTHE